MDRITPTYMGNTDTLMIDDAEVQDHPHIHGEYYSKNLSTSARQGSPPHTWGIQ